MPEALCAGCCTDVTFPPSVGVTSALLWSLPAVPSVGSDGKGEAEGGVEKGAVVLPRRCVRWWRASVSCLVNDRPQTGQEKGRWPLSAAGVSARAYL